MVLFSYASSSRCKLWWRRKDSARQANGYPTVYLKSEPTRDFTAHPSLDLESSWFYEGNKQIRVIEEIMRYPGVRMKYLDSRNDWFARLRQIDRFIEKRYSQVCNNFELNVKRLNKILTLKLYDDLQLVRKSLFSYFVSKLDSLYSNPISVILSCWKIFSDPRVLLNVFTTSYDNSLSGMFKTFFNKYKNKKKKFQKVYFRNTILKTNFN